MDREEGSKGDPSVGSRVVVVANCPDHQPVSRGAGGQRPVAGYPSASLSVGRGSVYICITVAMPTELQNKLATVGLVLTVSSLASRHCGSDGTGVAIGQGLLGSGGVFTFPVTISSQQRGVAGSSRMARYAIRRAEVGSDSLGLFPVLPRSIPCCPPQRTTGITGIVHPQTGVSSAAVCGQTDGFLQL
ncbi:hypothetical protein AAFF_G00111660 [Aldrovandia affinis]|uniref:Uncharacterized protein n=1 Tax=Aldrovandia affinis TaxID=143900 RepID=A0AAD7RTM2_9TELE|nr:hypothetical protein AAFF_G00111660 [Aldrovandia affinis]